MLEIVIGFDGVIENFEEEDGNGQVLIDNDWYQIDNYGEITERVTVH